MEERTVIKRFNSQVLLKIVVINYFHVVETWFNQKGNATERLKCSGSFNLHKTYHSGSWKQINSPNCVCTYGRVHVLEVVKSRKCCVRAYVCHPHLPLQGAEFLHHAIQQWHHRVDHREAAQRLLQLGDDHRHVTRLPVDVLLGRPEAFIQSLIGNLRRRRRKTKLAWRFNIQV